MERKARTLAETKAELEEQLRELIADVKALSEQNADKLAAIEAIQADLARLADIEEELTRLLAEEAALKQREVDLLDRVGEAKDRLDQIHGGNGSGADARAATDSQVSPQ